MAQEKRTASEEAPQGGSETQTSEDAGVPNADGEPLSLDMNATYQNPLNPEETITGVEFKAMLGEGALYRKVKSDFDQKSVENTKLVSENEELQTAREKAETALSGMQETQRVLKTLEQVGITGKSKSQDQYSEFDETPPAPDLEEMNRRFETFTQEQIDKGLEQLNTKAAERESEWIDTLQKQQETERYITQHMNSARQVTLDSYKATMPDIDVEKIESAMDMETLAAVKDAEAVTALRNGDQENWRLLHGEAEGYRGRSIKALSDMQVLQQQLSIEKQRKQEVESLSSGVVPEELSELKPARTKADARKNRAIRLGVANKNIATRDRALNR